MSLSKISKTKNLDVQTTVRNQVKSGDKTLFQVEASITQFTPKTSETDSSVVKKVTVSAVHEDVSKAQDKALEKAIDLLGL